MNLNPITLWLIQNSQWLYFKKAIVTAEKNMTKKKFIVMTTLVAILAISLLIPVSGSRSFFASTNTPYSESYTRSGVQYTTAASILGSSQVQYQTVKGAYTGDAANNTV